MKTAFSILIWIFTLLGSAVSGYPATTGTVDGNQDLVEEIKWLQAEADVFTAAKREQRISHAPSVVTVYTAEDIETQGLRSIAEILERTVGYFPTRNAANPLIGNRGIVAGENEPYLFLIDGHRINSLVDKGPGDHAVFPLISHAKRVEIIRGPGSTLWGGDAALGVVHVITKDGKDIDGLKTTVDAASEDLYRYANIQYGEGNGVDRDVMLSFTCAKSDGYPKEGFVPHEDWLSTTGLWGPMDRIKDSWELYGKMKHKTFTLSARASDLSDSRPINDDFTVAGGDPDRVKYNRRRHYYLTAKHNHDFDSSTSLETKVFSGLMERWQQAANPLLSPGLDHVDETFFSRETNLGAELTLRTMRFERHRLLAGLQFVVTEIDPVVQSASHPLPGVAGLSDYTLLVVPEQRDQTLAAYVEDDWQVVDDVTIIAGLRVDYNNLREVSTKFLPRLAAIWDVSQHWTAKYMFNTGYVRPPVAKSFLGQTPDINTFFGPLPHFGVDKSEEALSHDVQIAYHDRHIQSSLTAYHTSLDNAFNLYGRQVTTPEGTGILLYVNSNDITSYGLEFDFRHQLRPMFDWYGNYSWIISAEIDEFSGTTAGGLPYDWEGEYLVTSDKALTQFPRHMWNLGVNFRFQERLPLPQATLNIHYRGWTEMWAQNPDPPNDYLRLGPEHFVDANLMFKDIFTKTLELSIYAKNLLDNDDSRYFLPIAGYWSARGRSIGVKMSYTF